jgi:predicted NBD/HSP70 family sugar kinase
VLVALDRSAGAVVGLDFGHDSLRVAVADLSYSILAESYAELEVDTAAVDALDTAAILVSELIDEAGVDRGRVLAAGMGLPGPIDRESGRVHSQPILPGWVALDPQPRWSSASGSPCTSTTTPTSGALGESTFGVGRGTQ